MTPQRLIPLLANYHRKKWFPHTYPDPMGELVDFLHSDTLQTAPLYVSYYLYRIMIEHQFPDLYAEVLQSYRQAPRSPFYFVRSMNPEEARHLWEELEKWCLRYETLHQDWFRTIHQWQRKQERIEKAFFSYDAVSLEKELQNTREIFSRRLQPMLPASDLLTLLQKMRLSEWDHHADWNDFLALARSLPCSTVTKMEHNQQDPSEQMVFPIDPPQRVLLRYGTAAGPVDALRFTGEYGKGCFYRNFDPGLDVEFRIAGDAALPYFWGAVFMIGFSAKPSVIHYLGSAAEPLSDILRLILQFWFRYEAMLAAYYQTARQNLNDAQRHYEHYFDLAFALRPSSFLYLYELGGAGEAIFRYQAWRSALALEEQLKFDYGTDWFLSEKWIRKMKEYWWYGFQFSLEDILSDLGVSDFTGVFFLE